MIFLFPNTFIKLFGFPIVWLRAWLIDVVTEKRRKHSIRYLRLHYYNVNGCIFFFYSNIDQWEKENETSGSILHPCVEIGPHGDCEIINSNTNNVALFYLYLCCIFGPIFLNCYFHSKNLFVKKLLISMKDNNAHEIYSNLYDIPCIYILMIDWMSPNVQPSGIAI